MYELAWDGVQWVPVSPWAVGARVSPHHHRSMGARRARAHRAAMLAMQQQQQAQAQAQAMMAMRQQKPPPPAMFHPPPGGGCLHGECFKPPSTLGPPIAFFPGGGGGWPGGGGPSPDGGGGGGGGGGDGQPQQFNLWLVDVTNFGTFEQGMQVTNEQQLAQGDPQQLQRQQAEQYTATLPCLAPAGTGQVTVILPDGQKPSDGQGWGSTGQPCATDPNAQNLEPVGTAQPQQQQPVAATGWLPTALGWMPYPPYAGM
jgi:hypothetical protein